MSYNSTNARFDGRNIIFSNLITDFEHVVRIAGLMTNNNQTITTGVIGG